MYSSPFGSIFGQEDAPKAKAAPPKAVAKPAPKKQSAKIMQEMKDRIESVQKEEVYKPGQAKAKATAAAKKKIFDNTLPQFRAEVEVKSTDPEVRNEEAQFALEKAMTKFAAVKRKLAELKRKHKAARLYNDMLVQYTQLPASNKKQVVAWIQANMESIKKLSSARKLRKITKDTKEAAKATDLEIKHLEKLEALKKEGANVVGGRTLKSFRTQGMRSIRDSDIVPDKGPIPRFKGKVPVKEIVRLGNRGVSEIQGYGEDVDEFAKPDGLPSKKIAKEEKDVVLTRKMAKDLHKKGKFNEIFAKGLKSKRYYIKKRRARHKVDRLHHDAEKALLDKMQVEWDQEKLEKKVDKEVASYTKTQNTIKELIDQVKSSGPNGEQVTVAIGILSEARPDKFVTAVTLLDALKNSFKQLSQLGYFGQDALTPKEEAETLLAASAMESENAIRELETRQNTAAKLRAKVEDRPAPPPVKTPTPIVIVQVKQQLEQKEEARQKKEARVKQTVTILPMVVGGFILYKLFSGN